jgi:hypothetical protein
MEAFAPNEVLAKFEGLTRAPKAYTSVQCGRRPDDHMELNSDLVYSTNPDVSPPSLRSDVVLCRVMPFTVNHSCEPNVAFDLSSNDSSDWHVRALKEINVGDARTRNSSPLVVYDKLKRSDFQLPSSTPARNGRWSSHLNVSVGQRCVSVYLRETLPLNL